MAFWRHFAYRSRPCPYFRLRTRLLFSEDGKTALPGKRTHRMRRSFAKAWRNARWRDMLLAFLFWLSNGESLIPASVGPGMRY